MTSNENFLTSAADVNHCEIFSFGDRNDVAIGGNPFTVYPVSMNMNHDDGIALRRPRHPSPPFALAHVTNLGSGRIIIRTGK